MTFTEIDAYLLSKKGSSFDYPFDKELRSIYDAIIPGYHMNKKHWNTVMVQGDVDKKLLKELMDHSYTLIVESLTKKQREAIGK